MAHATLKRTGAKMPLVGFGLWKVTKSQCAETVYQALKAGYRLLDGAGDYGNEKEAGQGLARAIKDGIVKREEVFVTSKLWNTFHAREHVPVLAKKQLADWGLDYFDLFLIHFPISLKYVDPAHRYPPEWFNDNGKVETQNTPYQETWEAMEGLVEAGLVKNIGVSNIAGALLLDVFRYAKIQPAVIQVELHPYLTQEPILKLAETFGLAVTGYSSFGPASFVELNMDRGSPSLLNSNLIGGIAQAHGKTPAQVLLRWATQRGIAVIPKSNDHKRVAQNLQSVDFNLTVEELNAISGLNKNIRYNDPADIDPRLAIFA